MAAAKPPEPAAPPERPAEKGDTKWRASEDRLGLRLAVLEDVVRRANVELGRRVTELEKRASVVTS